jgi:hypothetical protein
VVCVWWGGTSTTSNDLNDLKQHEHLLKPSWPSGARSVWCVVNSTQVPDNAARAAHPPRLHTQPSLAHVEGRVDKLKGHARLEALAQGADARAKHLRRGGGGGGARGGREADGR